MLLNRKQVRKVLVRWKDFLTEAKEEPVSGPVIRIFDFDGTLTLYQDPQIAVIMKNPYMASFISPSFMQKLNDEHAVLPENIKEILSNTGPRTKNYIISKVSSAGFPKIKAEKLAAGLQNIEAKGDKNFEALANVVIKPKVSNWKALLAAGKVDEVIQRAKENLNIDDGGLADSSHVSSVMTQEEKIDQVLMSNKIDDKFARVYTKDNIAKTQEVPMDGGGVRNAQIKGSSGKFSPAHTIAQNAFAEFPDSIITFEIYDNSTSNVAEIESAVLKASSGEQEEVEAKSEDGLLRSLGDELGRRENVVIKKFQAVATEGGFELRDLAGTHISKSKGSKAEDVQESGPKLKFQKLKNKFFNLMNFLKKGGSAGRPSTATMNALESAVASKTGPLVQELFANTISAIATTGLEEKYSSKTALDELIGELYDFVSNYSVFKSAFDEAKSATPAKAAKATPKIPKAATPVAQPEPQQMQDQDYIRRLKRNIERADSAGDLEAADDLRAELDSYLEKETPSLKESLNRLRLVIKSK